MVSVVGQPGGRHRPPATGWRERLLSTLGFIIQRGVDAFGFGVVVVVGERLWLNRSMAHTLKRPPRFTASLDGWFEELYGNSAPAIRALYESHREGSWPEGAAIVPARLPQGGHCRLAFTACSIGPAEIWVPVDVSGATRDHDHFRLLFESSNDPHLIFDASGIVECNDAAVQLLGFSDKRQLLARHPATFSPERQPDGRLSSEKSIEMDRQAQEEGFHRFDWIHLKKDGSEVPVEVTLTPVELDSGPGHLVVWHDLSFRIERERELEAARQAAEASLASRQAFLASMSHELRTPMNAVLGLVEGLIEDGRIGGEDRESLEVIQTSGRQLRQILDDILDVSKFEAGELHLEAVPVRLADVVRETVALHRGRLAEGVVLQDASFSDEVSEWYLGDPVRLGQIVSNLLSNAVKFTSAGEVTVQVEANLREVVLYVQDTGIGMTEAQMDRIFEPFKQADIGTTRRFGGTGLGLTIVTHLVQAMGGTVEVRSRPGVGTRFTVFLPLDRVERASVHQDMTSECLLQGEVGPLKVLVAEDNRVNQLVLKRALAAFPNISTRFVNDGSEVADALADTRPDLVIMDVHMPEMDGLEATRRMRSAGYAGPVVAWTASCLDVEKLACMDAGMNQVLAKPLDRGALERILRAAWFERLATQPHSSEL